MADSLCLQKRWLCLHHFSIVDHNWSCIFLIGAITSLPNLIFQFIISKLVYFWEILFFLYGQKSRELGFNLSRTFENHLKQLVNHVDNAYGQNTGHGWWAGPDLNRRPSARQADVLTELDYRPSMFVGYFQYIALN